MTTKGRKGTPLNDPILEAKRLAHNEYHREYRKSHQMAEKQKEYAKNYRKKPEFQEWIKAYQIEYSQRPEVKKRNADYAFYRYWTDADLREKKLTLAYMKYHNLHNIE